MMGEKGKTLHRWWWLWKLTHRHLSNPSRHQPSLLAKGWPWNEIVQRGGRTCADENQERNDDSWWFPWHLLKTFPKNSIFFCISKKISRSLNNKKSPKLFKRFPHACSTSIIKFTTAAWGIETPHSTGRVGCTTLHTLGRWSVHMATLRPQTLKVWLFLVGYM